MIESALQSALQANEAAKQASRAKSAFLANMSHELRTPLNAIIGYSEMLAEEAADAGHDGSSRTSRRSSTAGKHLLGLINDILDLSKIEAGRWTSTSRRSRSRRSSAMSPRRPAAGREERQPPRAAPARGPSARCARTSRKVRQVLFNLLSNAAKFTEHGHDHAGRRAARSASRATG